MIKPKNASKTVARIEPSSSRKTGVVRNPLGFGLIEVMVAAALMSVVALGITSFMTQNNKNVLGMRTVSSRDQLAAVFTQALQKPGALTQSATYAGSVSGYPMNNNSGSSYSFNKCLYLKQCPSALTDFIFIDPASVPSAPTPLIGGYTAGKDQYPTAVDIPNATYFTASGQNCPVQRPSLNCPIAVGIQFKGNCTGGPPCTADFMNIYFTIYQITYNAASGQLGKPVLTDAGPTLQPIISRDMGVALPYNAAGGSFANHIATWDTNSAPSYALFGWQSNAGGNLGFGTPTPNYLIDVDTNPAAGGVPAAQAYVNIQNSAPGVNTDFKLFAGTTAADSGYVTFGVSGSGKAFHFADPTNTALSYVTITDSSQIGIGTSSPTAGANLDIFNAGTAKINLRGAGGNGTLTTDGTGTMLNSVAGNVALANGGTPSLITYSDGQVGINAGVGAVPADGANPKLDVVNTGGQAAQFMGTVSINTTPMAGYDLTVAGNIYAPDVTTPAISDMRLKKDITPIESALDKILQLKGVTYHWKDPKRSPDLQMGVIAQDVKKVFPEVVSKRPDGYYGVEYKYLVAPLIEAVKELKKSNDDLRDQVKALKGEVETLKSQQKSR